MHPAAYPAKNTEEMKAVLQFLTLLDLEKVKPDAKFLDKVPNLDGSVELVDDDQRPVGELKIQIKKIPDGTRKFDCPVELVAYSHFVSSPFLLVCVDVGNRKAYWRHISMLMPEFKRDQKTFTVKFQPIVDEIGEGFSYFERWLEHCKDYSQRVSEFPKLQRKIDEEIGLNNLHVDDRRLFQQFIEEINVLLDVDLPVVKHEFFADTWKLGISVHRADTEIIAFSIYTIQNGENAPLVIHVPKASEPPRISLDNGQHIEGIIAFHLEGSGPDVSTEWMLRKNLNNPLELAREFIFRYFNKLLKGRGLHIHGRNQSTELLMKFLRNYAHTFGLPNLNHYKVSDISYGLNVFFPMWYSMSFPCTMNYFQENYAEMLQHNPLPLFEQIANDDLRPMQPTEADVRKALKSQLRPHRWPIRTYDISFEHLRQAVDFLVAAEVSEISQQYRPHTRGGKWVWDFYAPEDLKANAIAMLCGAAEDYPVFVKGNQFGRLNCPLITGEKALVVTMTPSRWVNTNHPPILNSYLVENTNRTLPLLTLVDLDEEPGALQEKGENIVLRGVRKKRIVSKSLDFSHLIQNQPIQKIIYGWIADDLNDRFGNHFQIS